MSFNTMLLFVSADVKQATIVQVKFPKWLSKMKVIGTKEDSHSGAERKSEHCVKSVPVNPEKDISGTTTEVAVLFWPHFVRDSYQFL